MVDAFITNQWPTIQARQDTFRTNAGRYWQGLMTHTASPAHTNAADGSALGDRLAFGPSGQASTWLDMFPEWASELLPAAITIDVYESAQGHGWTLRVQAQHNGVEWRRVVNVGSETQRVEAWRQAPPPPSV